MLKLMFPNSENPHNNNLPVCFDLSIEDAWRLINSVNPKTVMNFVNFESIYREFDTANFVLVPQGKDWVIVGISRSVDGILTSDIYSAVTMTIPLENDNVILDWNFFKDEK